MANPNATYHEAFLLTICTTVDEQENNRGSPALFTAFIPASTYHRLHAFGLQSEWFRNGPLFSQGGGRGWGLGNFLGG